MHMFYRASVRLQQNIEFLWLREVKLGGISDYCFYLTNGLFRVKWEKENWRIFSVIDETFPTIGGYIIFEINKWNELLREKTG